MTAADGQIPGTGYPWHDPAPAPGATGARAAVTGMRAGLVTRSLANVVDLIVVTLLVAGGYAGIAAARYLLGPTSFTFPAAAPATLLLVGLCVQAVYFTITWRVVGGTYGNRLLGLRVTGDRAGRPGWGRCAVRAVLCTLFPVGLLWVPVSAGNRSVQDLLVRTSVVYG